MKKRKSNTESLTSRLIYRTSYYCGTEVRVSDDEAHCFLCQPFPKVAERGVVFLISHLLCTPDPCFSHWHRMYHLFTRFHSILILDQAIHIKDKVQITSESQPTSTLSPIYFMYLSASLSGL